MRKELVDKGHPQLSVRRQCELLGVNRNRLKPPVPNLSEEDRRIMDLLDKIHLKEPTYGARMLKIILARDHDVRVGRKRLRRLMILACIHACYCKPRTSIPGKGHKIHPYLLRDRAITEADQAWCSDITYIPMGKGFCYLCAVMDWHTRAVLGWAISTTIDTNLCLEAFRRALRATGKTPGIMNTDQGSQYTAEGWTKEMDAHEIRISMDGKGRWVDNVFIERLWRSLKYEDVYLKAYGTPRELELGLSDWINRYNHYRPHSAHDGRTPWDIYIGEDGPERRQVA